MARQAKSKSLRLEEEPHIWLDTKGRYAWEIARQHEDGSAFRKGGACTTLAAAVARRDAAIATFETGRQPQRYTVNQWARHCLDVIWPRAVRDGQMKADTAWSHESILNNHILPIIGGVWIDAVSSAHIDKLGAHLDRLGRDPDTVANIRNTGSKLYSTALERTPPVVTHNPFKGWRINRSKARRDETTGHRLEHRRILTEAEETELLSWAEAHWAYGMILAALGMGLRKGEVTGMTWPNVDWDGETYYVEEQVRRSKAKGGLEVQDLKTSPSERHVPIPPLLMDWLRCEHARPDRHPVKIHANTNGNWISPEDADEALDDLRMIARLTNKCDERGTPLPDVGWHDLRHTFATRLANMNPPVAPRTLMELMGHSDIQTTFSYYVATSFAAKRDAINRRWAVPCPEPPQTVTV